MGDPRPRSPLPSPLRAALLAGLVLLTACATAPRAPETQPEKVVSSADEVRLGERYFGYARQSQGGDWVADPDLVAYVRKVGARLGAVAERPDLPFAFAVLDNPAPSAWALPGGKVAVTRGLLTHLDSEAELAAVLAHQIAHAETRREARELERDVLARLGGVGITAVSDGLGHGMPEELVVGRARLGAVLTHLRYDAGEEAEADRAGMENMVRAGYDPAATVVLLERLTPLADGDDPDGWQRGMFGAHPVSPERLEAARKTLAGLPEGGETGEAAYRAAVAPLLALGPAYDLLAEGEQALEDGDPDGAARKAEAGFAKAPHLANLQALLGAARMAQERWADAEAALDTALEDDPGYYRTWLARGKARAALGDAKGARADLEKSLELLPTASADLALGRILLDAGELESGRYHLRQAAKAGGAAGREAAEILTRNEIGEVPGRYVAVGAGLRPDGTLFLVIQNRSPMAVKNVRVTVTLTDPNTGQPRTAAFTFEGPFAPGSREPRDTGYGPLPPEASTTLRTQVTGAELVAPDSP
jgi:predicted Zn-dependent protease